jgi:tetratricopeptide (TPR) repeat protein
MSTLDHNLLPPPRPAEQNQAGIDLRRARELLNDGGSIGPMDLVASCRLRVSRAADSNPAALDLLRLMAFLAPEPLPVELLLTARPEHLGPRLGSVVGDAEALDKLVGVLRGYSLASSDDHGIRVQEHVQACIRHDLGRQQAALWAERAARLVLDAFPVEPYDSRQWERISRLKAHAVTAAKYTEHADADYAWRLLSAVGIYLGSRGCNREQLREAFSYLSQARELAEGRFGPHARQVAFILKALGPVSYHLDDTPSARHALERALQIEQTPTDLREPDYRTAAALNNLGLVLLHQGDSQLAWEMIKKALAICEAVYGPSSHESAWPLHSLGMALRKLHDLPGARNALNRALVIQQTAYGPGHIEVARTLYALAEVLYDQGDLHGALAALEDALPSFETAYGNTKHPLVMATLLHLTLVNLRLRRLRAAWHNLRRVRFLEDAGRAA